MLATARLLVFSTLSLLVLISLVCVGSSPSYRFSVLKSTQTSFKVLFTIPTIGENVYTFPHHVLENKQDIDTYAASWFLEFGSPYFTESSPRSGDCSILPAQLNTATGDYEPLMSSLQSTLTARLYTPGKFSNQLKRLYFTPTPELNHADVNKVVGLSFRMTQEKAQKIFPDFADKIPSDGINNWLFECRDVTTIGDENTSLVDGLYLTPHHAPWNGDVVKVDTGTLYPQRLLMTTTKTPTDGPTEFYQQGYIPQEFIYTLPSPGVGVTYSALQTKILNNSQTMFEGGKISIPHLAPDSTDLSHFDKYFDAGVYPELRCVLQDLGDETSLRIARLNTDLRGDSSSSQFLFEGTVAFKNAKTDAVLTPTELKMFTNNCLVVIYFPPVLAPNLVFHPFFRTIELYHPGNTNSIPITTTFSYEYKRNYTFRHPKFNFVSVPPTQTIDQAIEHYYCGPGGYATPGTGVISGECTNPCPTPYLSKSPMCALKRCGDFNLDYMMHFIDRRLGGITIETPYGPLTGKASDYVKDSTHTLIFTPDGRPIITLKSDTSPTTYHPPSEAIDIQQHCALFKGFSLYSALEQRLTKKAYSINFHDIHVTSLYFPFMLIFEGSPEMIFADVTNWIQNVQLMWIDGRMKKTIQLDASNLEIYNHPAEQPTERVDVYHPINSAVFLHSKTIRCLCRYATTSQPLLRLVWFGKEFDLIMSPTNCTPFNTAFQDVDGDCQAFAPNTALQERDEHQVIVPTKNLEDNNLYSQDVLITAEGSLSSQEIMCDKQWGLIGPVNGQCTCAKGSTMVYNTDHTQQRCIPDNLCKCKNLDTKTFSSIHYNLCQYYTFSQPGRLGDMDDVHDWNLLSYKCDCTATGMIDLPNPSNVTQTETVPRYMGLYCDVPARCSHAASCDVSKYIQPMVKDGKCVKGKCECIKNSNYFPINPEEDITIQGCQCGKLMTKPTSVCHIDGTHGLTYSPLRCDILPTSDVYKGSVVVENTLTFQGTTQPQMCYCKDEFGGDRCQYPAVFISLTLTHPDEDLGVDERIGERIAKLFVNDHHGREQGQSNLISYLTMSNKLEDNTINPKNGVFVSLFSHEPLDKTTTATKAVFKVWSAAHPVPDGYSINNPIAVDLQDAKNGTSSIQRLASNFVSSPKQPQFHPLQQTGSQFLADLWDQLLQQRQQVGVNSGIIVGEPNDLFDPSCESNSTTTHCSANGIPPAVSETVHSDQVTKQNKDDQDSLSGLFELNPDFKEEGSPSKIVVIVSVVIGLIFVIIIFIVITIAVHHCRKHEKACFKKKKGADQVEKRASTTAGNLEMSAQSLPQSIMPTVDAAMQNDPTLPTGWKAQHDPNSGKTFYMNSITMESSWVHPLKKADNGW